MAGSHWGASFDADALARLETRMWKAYYRRQPARLFGLLVQAIRAQAGVSWPRALAASLLLTRAAAGFARATGDYDRFAGDIARGYRMLRLPAHVDVEAVARYELRWWSSGARSGSPRGAPPASPSRTYMRRSTTSRAIGSRKPAGSAGWPLRSAIGAPPPIPMVRREPGSTIGRRWPGSCGRRIGASERPSDPAISSR
jgi:hypothetical protein